MRLPNGCSAKPSPRPNRTQNVTAFTLSDGKPTRAVKPTPAVPKAPLAAGAGPGCVEGLDMASRFGKSATCGLAASLLLLLSGPAAADQVTGTLRVSLRVVASCSVQTQSLALADYTSGGQSTGTASPGAIDVTCARGTPAAVYLDGNRTLQGPNGDRVAYEVSANGSPWRAGEPIHIKGMGQAPVHLALTGSVPAGQKVPVGNYEDQVVVRVVY